MNENEILNGDEDDFHFRANQFRSLRYTNNPNRFDDDINEFVKHRLNSVPDLYKLLAKLPFKTICNLVPDFFLETALYNTGRFFEKEHYDFKVQTERTVSLENETQFIYNIYGTYKHPESIAVTHKEHLEQVRNIVSDVPKIPNAVINRFTGTGKTFLFIGFDFNAWHHRLIMESLKIKKPEIAYFPESGHYQVAVVAKDFYAGNYGMTFLPIDTDAFIKEIVDKYEDLFGKADRNLNIFIDYSDQEEKQYLALIRNMKIACNGRNFTYFSKNDGFGGSVFNIDDIFAMTDVYIPLLSVDFLSEESNNNRVKQAVGNTKIKTILINAKFVALERLLNNFTKMPSILPSLKTPLSTYSESDNKVYDQISNKINSILI
ncbi:SIR2 family protein [Pedobacter alluvionis]|nr:SIR2 family protein [Pedobacter alluvionis]